MSDIPWLPAATALIGVTTICVGLVVDGVRHGDTKRAAVIAGGILLWAVVFSATMWWVGK